MKKILVLTTFFSIVAMFTWSQTHEDIQIPLIGERAPSFEGESTMGVIHFPEDYGSKWKILFSHPKDFTPVCSSEILELAAMADEFKELNASVVVLSTDLLSQHETWKASLESVNYRGQGEQEISFPLVADESKLISNKYGMLHASSSTSKAVRGVFIISPDNIVEAIYFYPMDVGRNMDEIKRTLIALQTTDGHILTPANWNPGDDVMLSYLSDEQKAELESPGSDVYQLDWFMTFMKLR